MEYLGNRIPHEKYERKGESEYKRLLKKLNSVEYIRDEIGNLIEIRRIDKLKAGMI